MILLSLFYSLSLSLSLGESARSIKRFCHPPCESSHPIYIYVHSSSSFSFLYSRFSGNAQLYYLGSSRRLTRKNNFISKRFCFSVFHNFLLFIYMYMYIYSQRNIISPHTLLHCSIRVFILTFIYVYFSHHRNVERNFFINYSTLILFIFMYFFFYEMTAIMVNYSILVCVIK